MLGWKCIGWKSNEEIDSDYTCCGRGLRQIQKLIRKTIPAAAEEFHGIAQDSRVQESTRGSAPLRLSESNLARIAPASPVKRHFKTVVVASLEVLSHITPAVIVSSLV